MITFNSLLTSRNVEGLIYISDIKEFFNCNYTKAVEIQKKLMELDENKRHTKMA